MHQEKLYCVLCIIFFKKKLLQFEVCQDDCYEQKKRTGAEDEHSFS